MKPSHTLQCATSPSSGVIALQYPCPPLYKVVLHDSRASLCNYTNVNLSHWSHSLTHKIHLSWRVSTMREKGVKWKAASGLPVFPGIICTTRDLKNHLKIQGARETARDKWKQRKSMYVMIMSLEIISAVVRSCSRAPGGFRSVGRSPGPCDSEDWMVSILLVR